MHTAVVPLWSYCFLYPRSAVRPYVLLILLVAVYVHGLEHFLHFLLIVLVVSQLHELLHVRADERFNLLVRQQ